MLFRSNDRCESLNYACMMRTIGEESGACSAIQFRRFQFAETVASGQNMAALQLYSSNKQKRGI